MRQSILRLIICLAALGIACPARSADTHMEKLGRLPVAVLTSELDTKLWTSERLAEMNKCGIAAGINLCVEAPYGRHLGAVVPKANGKCCVWLDGKESPTYDQVRNTVKGAYRDQEFRFSPDGCRLAYTARKGSKWVMVVDGKESAEFDGIREPCFSADSKHICYVGFRDKDCVLVLDGKECGKYPGICMDFPSFTARTPQRDIENAFCPGIFGPDGRFAFAASKGRGKNGVERVVAVIDGKQTSEYEDIDGIEFSPDGKHVAFVARKADREFVVLDGKQSAVKYDDIDGLLTFSPDSKHLAYVATRFGDGADDRSFVVVDGKAGTSFQQVYAISLSFSPDSKHFSYSATPRDGKYCVVVDGKPGREYDEVGEIGREPCQLYGPDGRLYYRAKSGEKCYMVMDGVPSRAYDDIWEPYPVLSKDGKHHAFTAKKGEEWFVVHDGAEGAHYGNVDVRSVAIAGDNKLVYGATRANSGQSIAVIGGKEQPNAGNPTPSPDGTRIAYMAGNDDFLNTASVMLDGRKTGEFESVLTLTFDESNRLRFLAVRDEIKGGIVEKSLYRVEVPSE